MNKVKQLIIAMACGFDTGHELIKQALDTRDIGDFQRATVITKEDLFTKTSTGKTIFEYKQTWQNLDRLIALCPDLRGVDFLETGEDDKPAVERAKEHSLQDEIFRGELWTGEVPAFEEAWLKYAKSSGDYEKFLSAKRSIAKAEGRELREDQFERMGIKYADIENAIKNGDFEEIRKKLDAHGDHLRPDDVLLLRYGNHMLDTKAAWEKIEVLWAEFAAHGEQMQPEHFLFKRGTRNSPLEVAFKTASMPEKIFNADLWAGRMDQMMGLYNAAAETSISSFDLKKVKIDEIVRELAAREFSDTLRFDDSLEKAVLLTGFHQPLPNKDGVAFTTTALALPKTWENMEQVREVLRGKGEQLTLDDLRQVSGPMAEPYLMHAARFGHFDQVLAILEETGEKLSVEDLTQSHGNGKSVFDMLADHDQTGLILQPELWVGREEEFCAFWEEFPNDKRRGIDFDNLRGEVIILTLRNHFNPAGGHSGPTWRNGPGSGPVPAP